jgi:hypothetical protein
MEINKQGFISRQSEIYADGMSNGDTSRQFCRGDIAAAYIVGASEVLQHVFLIINASAKADNGLSAEQAQKLVGLIRCTEGIKDGW